MSKNRQRDRENDEFFLLPNSVPFVLFELDFFFSFCGWFAGSESDVKASIYNMHEK